MAIASIFVGILSGVCSFLAALLFGHGFLTALAIYAVMGLVGALLAAGLCLMRPRAFGAGYRAGDVGTVGN